MKIKLFTMIVLATCILVAVVTAILLYSSKTSDLQTRNSQFKIEMEKLSPYAYINGDEILLTSTQHKTQNDIYSYSISTGKTTQITHKTDTSEVFPTGNEKYLAWLENSSSKSEKDKIVLYDRQTMKSKVFSNPEFDCTGQILFEDYLIWREQKNESGKLKVGFSAYKISTSEIFEICSLDFGNSTGFGCDGKNAVWSKYNGDLCQIIVFNLETRTKQIISHENLKASTPKIDGDIIVWEDHRNYGSGDIYAYVISKKCEVAIDTRKDINSKNPRIKGNKIVYLSRYAQDKENNFITFASINPETPSPEITDICTRKSIKFTPKTDGKWAIWEEKDSLNSKHSKVVAFHLEDNFETTITDDGRFSLIKNGLCIWFAQDKGKLVANGIRLK